ncbi:conserved hypothetical protein, partial [Stigmatella aurantiaca DW4/3-1]
PTPPPVARTWAPHSSSKDFSPGTALSAASVSAWIFPFMGQAGVVSSIFSFTASPLMRMSFTIPAFTRSTCNSGSTTLDIAARMSRSETLIGNT